MAIACAGLRDRPYGRSSQRCPSGPVRSWDRFCSHRSISLSSPGKVNVMLPTLQISDARTNIRPKVFCSAVIAVATIFGGNAPAAERPNIVLIMADDMGYGDLGCFGGEMTTPHLDGLAARGVRWTQFYNAAQCCPTRAALMTGMYSHQAGVGDMIDGHSKATREAAASPQYTTELKHNALTIAEQLRPGGYQTFMTGKWHLGYDDGERPVHRGFDRYFGIIGGADSYWQPKSLREDDRPVQVDPKNFYATNAFTDYAMRFVRERDPERPFFLYLAYNAPHSPLHARDEEVEQIGNRYAVGWDVVRRRRFERMKELGILPSNAILPSADAGSHSWESEPDKPKRIERMTKYAAIVERMDWNIGRLLKLLDEQKIADDTLIVFLSDNGAWASEATYGHDWAEAASPFRYFKTWTHEGGVRTPLIVSWPRRLADRGRIERKRYGHIIDLLPTFLAAAGSAPVATGGALPIVGRNLLPAWTTPNDVVDVPVYWERLGHGALRDGDWKIVRVFNSGGNAVQPAKRTGAWELYNLADDPTESRNLANVHPDRVSKMQSQYDDWQRSVGVVDREIILKRIAELGLTNE
ncbi:MAG: arylsulfatase [Pirellula sp.]|nr:arylsulfatase [Pirellula sp.]